MAFRPLQLSFAPLDAKPNRRNRRLFRPSLTAHPLHSLRSLQWTAPQELHSLTHATCGC